MAVPHFEVQGQAVQEHIRVWRNQQNHLSRVGSISSMLLLLLLVVVVVQVFENLLLGFHGRIRR